MEKKNVTIHNDQHHLAQKQAEKKRAEQHKKLVEKIRRENTR